MIIRLQPYLIALPILFVAWIAILAGVMRLTGQAPAALVMLPPDGFVARLPARIAVTSQGPLSVTLKSADAGFVAALYAAGAPLVLPAGLAGCLPQG
jgi:hypothetical protein